MSMKHEIALYKMLTASIDPMEPRFVLRYAYCNGEYIIGANGRYLTAVKTKLAPGLYDVKLEGRGNQRAPQFRKVEEKIGSYPDGVLNNIPQGKPVYSMKYLATTDKTQRSVQRFAIQLACATLWSVPTVLNEEYLAIPTASGIDLRVDFYDCHAAVVFRPLECPSAGAFAVMSIRCDCNAGELGGVFKEAKKRFAKRQKKDAECNVAKR